jgi:glycosyltransferase involved in cell wall biosynthesis
MPTKANVLVMVDSFDMGGAESQAVLLARLLRDDGTYAVSLACLRREGVLLEAAEALGLGEIPEYRLTSFYNRNMVTQLRRFVSFLKERRIDVVHPQSFYTNIFGTVGAALARVPVRIAFRGETAGWRTPAQNFIERCSYRLASAVHANSEAVRDYLTNSGISPDKIITVHNGLDLARVTPPPGLARDEALAILGLPLETELRFVTIVANMRHEVKDHQMFLRAAARVYREFPNAGFVLAGEGELLESLRQLSIQLGIGKNVFFIGPCEKIAALLFISDVCVLSSKAEGFSNSILEYMAAARPVVATDVGGAREAIAEGESGYLVPSGDDADMAARIVTLLHDPALAHAMGQRSREIVEQRFSSQAQLEHTSALYARLLAQAGIRQTMGGPKSVE